MPARHNYKIAVFVLSISSGPFLYSFSLLPSFTYPLLFRKLSDNRSLTYAGWLLKKSFVSKPIRKECWTWMLESLNVVNPNANLI